MRKVLVVLLILGVAVLSAQASTGGEGAGSGDSLGIPLPQGTPLSDEELLCVEGDLGFLVALAVTAFFGAAAGAGAAAIHENWFDEDYGIDRDDRMTIAFGAISGFMTAATGGVSTHFFPV
jgi:hypothetical protein